MWNGMEKTLDSRSRTIWNAKKLVFILDNTRKKKSSINSWSEPWRARKQCEIFSSKFLCVRKATGQWRQFDKNLITREAKNGLDWAHENGETDSERKREYEWQINSIIIITKKWRNDESGRDDSLWVVPEKLAIAHTQAHSTLRRDYGTEWKSVSQQP